ncbi:MAG: nucleotidyltransferase domain-containing protein [Phaeodactylibacter sp.]|nr:nucleotidyltransferase domain-containing protein [Phaeodactylibacter sp.]
MAEKKEILDFIRREKENLLRKYHLTKIGLFGSFARDEQKAGSDIDLIVEFEPGTENLYEIKEEIRKVFQEQFHSKVDVCREKYIKPYYKEQILEDAIFI